MALTRPYHPLLQPTPFQTHHNTHSKPTSPYNPLLYNPSTSHNPTLYDHADIHDGYGAVEIKRVYRSALNCEHGEESYSFLCIS